MRYTWRKKIRKKKNFVQLRLGLLVGQVLLGLGFKVSAGFGATYLDASLLAGEVYEEISVCLFVWRGVGGCVGVRRGARMILR